MNPLQKIINTIRQFFKTQSDTLGASIASTEFASYPPAVKTELQSLHASMLQTHALIPEVAPAEADAASLTLMQRVTETLSAGYESVQRQAVELKNALGAKVKEFNDLNAKITAGDFIAKAAHEAAVGTARKEERDALIPEVVAARKSGLELAKLPVPSEDILKLPKADYDKRFETCGANMKTLAAKGLKPDNHGKKLVECCAWLEEEPFKTEFEKYADLIKPGARRTESNIDPLQVDDEPEDGKPNVGTLVGYC